MDFSTLNIFGCEKGNNEAMKHYYSEAKNLQILKKLF
jgi:hypothetical protein